MEMMNRMAFYHGSWTTADMNTPCRKRHRYRYLCQCSIRSLCCAVVLFLHIYAVFSTIFHLWHAFMLMKWNPIEHIVCRFTCGYQWQSWRICFAIGVAGGGGDCGGGIAFCSLHLSTVLNHDWWAHTQLVMRKCDSNIHFSRNRDNVAEALQIIFVETISVWFQWMQTVGNFDSVNEWQHITINKKMCVCWRKIWARIQRRQCLSIGRTIWMDKFYAKS